MRLPGFKAEASLQEARGSYVSEFSYLGREANGSVTPAQRLAPLPLPPWSWCATPGLSYLPYPGCCCKLVQTSLGMECLYVEPQE
jgi:hypothetical protein